MTQREHIENLVKLSKNDWAEYLGKMDESERLKMENELMGLCQVYAELSEYSFNLRIGHDEADARKGADRYIKKVRKALGFSCH